MAFSSSCSLFIFISLLLIQFCSTREILEKPKSGHNEETPVEVDHFDPALHVFFHVEDLYEGKKMPIYFSVDDPLKTPRLLAKEEADSIPFSMSKLPYLLELMSIPEGSAQAEAMEHTLGQCELEAAPGEVRFCATSLESMMEWTREVLNTVRLKALTTKIHNITIYSKNDFLDEYTFVNKPLEIHVTDEVACHTMAYPYAIYYCHSQRGKSRVFEITLRGKKGNTIDSVAVCHSDTSKWDKDHVSFRMLGVKPGSAPVCHFLPADNVVWIPSA